MNNIDKLISSIGMDRLKKGGLCVFAGAGISYNSGIPISNDIKRYIIGKLFENKPEQDLMMKSGIPFEIFLEILFNNYTPNDFNPLNTSIDIGTGELIKQAALALVELFNGISKHKSFFNIFDNGNYEPNANHYFIAEMLRNGKSKIAVTTNFDILIEKAYKNLTGKELRVYLSHEWRGINPQFPCLIKLHGGCQNINSIETTIEKIASRNAAEHCRETIEYIFNKGQHSNILILGYSFSDVFDISPSIESISHSKKNIIYIRHMPNELAQENINQSIPVFQGFKGYQIKCNTDDIISSLIKIHSKVIPITSYEENKIDLENIIGSWSEGLTVPHKRLFLCGLLMDYVNRPVNAKAYFEQCLRTDEANVSEHYRNAVMQNLKRLAPIGSVVYNVEDDELLQGASAEQRIIELINSIPGKTIKGEHKAGLDICEKALELAKRINNKMQEGTCYAAMVDLYNNLGEYKHAVEFGEKALKIFCEDSDFQAIKMECRTYCYLSASYDHLNIDEKKIEYMNKAIDLAKRLNMNNEIAAEYFYLANSINTSINTRENLRKCIDYFKLGYEFCKDKDYVNPLIKNSALLSLGANIMALYLENEDLVTQDELRLAYELIKDQAESNELGIYGSGVTIEMGTSMGIACMALGSYGEALTEMLSIVSRVDLDNAERSKKRQLIYTLSIWFEKQEKECYEYMEHNMTAEMITDANIELEDAYTSLQRGDINTASQALRKAFMVIPVQSSFRSTIPFILYRNIQNIRVELRNAYYSLVDKA